MNSKRNPSFKKETLFLKMMVEGDADLFLYEEVGLIRFFYRLDNGIPEQLVYKRYKVPNEQGDVSSGNNKIATNNYYQQQMTVNMQCGREMTSLYSKARYVKSDLGKAFNKFNECKGGELINYFAKGTKAKFGLNFRPGINFSSLKITQSSVPNFTPEFENRTNLRLGLEIEYFLPFNNNRWSIIFEPTYQYFRSESTTPGINGELHEVDYQSIEVPVGGRFSFNLGESSKLFINTVVIIDADLNSFFDFAGLNDFRIRTSATVGLGVGYKYLDRYSLELRTRNSRDLLGEFALWSAEYETFSIIFGYTFL